MIKIDKLNLGCGRDVKAGYLNVDCKKNPGVDLVFDLNILPWPLKKSGFKEIVMTDILEHLDKPEKVLEEVYRISKPGALIKISVPHFSSYAAYADITHKRPFSYFSFDYYDIRHAKNGSLEDKREMQFRIKRKISFSRIQELLGVGRLLNKMPKFYERILAFIVPAGGLYFELEVVKPERLGK